MSSLRFCRRNLTVHTHTECLLFGRLVVKRPACRPLPSFKSAIKKHYVEFFIIHVNIALPFLSTYPIQGHGAHPSWDRQAFILHVFGLWEEIKENPRWHNENMQVPHKKARLKVGSNSRPCCCEATVLSTSPPCEHFGVLYFILNHWGTLFQSLLVSYLSLCYTAKPIFIVWILCFFKSFIGECFSLLVVCLFIQNAGAMMAIQTFYNIIYNTTLRMNS